MERKNAIPLSFLEADPSGDGDILLGSCTNDLSTPFNLWSNTSPNRTNRHTYAQRRMLSLPLPSEIRAGTWRKTQSLSNKPASDLQESNLGKNYLEFSGSMPSRLPSSQEMEIGYSFPIAAASSAIEFSQRSTSVLDVSPCKSISPLLDIHIEQCSLPNYPHECGESSHHRPPKWGNVQVIIDIDDTILSSGGVKLFNFNIGGIDQQYKRGELYPGSAQFVFELAINKLRSDEQPLSVAVLTARIPQVPVRFDSSINQKLISTAERSGIKNWGIDCDRKVMYSTLNEWFFQETKAARKYDNFLTIYRQMSKIHNNMLYIWIGDTGEMDEEVGEMMANTFPENMNAVFLHYVSEKYQPNAKLPLDRAVNGVPFVYFRTYVDAARKACESKLLSELNATRVIVQAIRDLDALKVTSFSSKWFDLLRDWQKSETLFHLRDSSIPTVRHAYEIVKRQRKEFSKCLKIRTKNAAST
ncbi:hypothetical protein IE077_002914 [Cardiosporidium cionae]|uniref:Uncharacterized protein n=1 Tax=Cardiosporidium cionae TaxID=476202 RepID=A0ABQ7J9T2_9APIC|nr:hypothetical protein IE077_002914 [Cardiosporidium cionae]|eukprot:KAF8820694.1 hypothetical protein IE077_002914 [Cardiosporidium cionae]